MRSLTFRRAFTNSSSSIKLRRFPSHLDVAGLVDVHVEDVGLAVTARGDRAGQIHVKRLQLLHLETHHDEGGQEEEHHVDQGMISMRAFFG